MKTVYDWVAIATSFDIGPSPLNGCPTTIDSRNQRNGSKLWVISQDGSVLGRDAIWHYEPPPSCRTMRFLQNTRFATKEKAYDFWTQYIKEIETK